MSVIPPSSSSSSSLSAQVALPPLDQLVARSSKRTRLLFSTQSDLAYSSDPTANDPTKAHLSYKISSEYSDAKQLPATILAQQSIQGPTKPGSNPATINPTPNHLAKSKKRVNESYLATLIDDIDGTNPTPTSSHTTTDSEPSQRHPNSLALTVSNHSSSSSSSAATAAGSLIGKSTGLLSQALVHKKELASKQAKPAHHPDWKLYRVISGHLGWVRSVAVEPGNKWFATGAGDRMIKIWDLASGELKLSLTGHISTVRGLAVSSRHPYLFSCGEDKMVKCWDLEHNKVIRQYQGHLSGIYSLTLHPTLDVLITAGRDATARVWDMRTRSQIHVLSGHKGTVASVVCQDSDPQVITGSMDATVKLWDLAAGKCYNTLTHHKKSIRALAVHPSEYTFASGSAGGRNIKTWKCPEGTLINNMSHETIVNTLAVNHDGVLFSGGDDGSLKFYDYATGIPFQSAEDLPQPGSLDAEAGVFASTFDQTGTRLITACADKTIKIYREV